MFGWWNVQQQFNSEALALNNFGADMPTGLRNTDIQAQNNLDAGLKAFHNGDLEGAVALFSSIEMQNDSFASTVAYYLGQTYFKLKQYDKAVNEFEKVVTSNDIRFKDNADWYNVLANLANGKEVTQSLAAIATNENHPYQIQAQELQQKMNSIWKKIAN
ncbi:MAG: tetratricopeptide repeat protein [Saprospiraceae bacterium]|nr:tetratricopeptide repeat protein [Saprospiraceae bacterium]